jgi:hypothetical protein
MQRLKIRVVAGESPILWIERDGAFEVRDGFGVLVPLCMGDRQHVEGVIVVGILVANQAKVCNRLVVLAAVDGERGRVQTLGHSLRRIFTLGSLSLADIQVEADPLEKLLLVRVLPEHALERVYRRAIVMTLKRVESPLVKGDRLEVGRSPLRTGRCRAFG